jgi:proteasome lid subunit RPN8/RPN11
MTIQKEKRALIPETVWLSSNALDEIDDFQPTSGRECAAWLFGRRFHDRVEVHAVDGWVRGEPWSVLLPRDPQLELRHQDDGLQLVGDLHTHPSYADPSPEDERSWTSNARKFGRPVVGLIVGGSAPDSPFPFADPIFRAWMAGPK